MCRNQDGSHIRVSVNTENGEITVLSTRERLTDKQTYADFIVPRHGIRIQIAIRTANCILMMENKKMIMLGIQLSMLRKFVFAIY